MSLCLRRVAALLLVAIAPRASGAEDVTLVPPSSAACGEGPGDLREAAAAVQRCNECQGRLRFDAFRQHTLCIAGEAAVWMGACGGGEGDLTAVLSSFGQCQNCTGDLYFDPLRQHTLCVARDEERPHGACGDGAGDLREVPAAVSACSACRGRLGFAPLAGPQRAGMGAALGYTNCFLGEAASSLRWRSATVDEVPYCGEGAGDQRGQERSIFMCTSCRGSLHYDLRRGHTLCIVGEVRLGGGGVGDCGEGEGDLRQVQAASALCQACGNRSHVLSYDPFLNRTLCVGPFGAQPAAQPLVEEGSSSSLWIVLAAAMACMLVVAVMCLIAACYVRSRKGRELEQAKLSSLAGTPQAEVVGGVQASAV